MNIPFDTFNFFSGADEFNSRGPKERHGEITRKVDPAIRKANIDRKSLYQIFAIVAVVERAGPIEESNRRIDRGLFPSIPGDAQMSVSERSRFINRNRKAKGTNCSFALQIRRND